LKLKVHGLICAAHADQDTIERAFLVERAECGGLRSRHAWERNDLGVLVCVLVDKAGRVIFCEQAVYLRLGLGCFRAAFAPLYLGKIRPALLGQDGLQPLVHLRGQSS